MFLGCEMTKFVLVRLKCNIARFTLVLDNEFRLWVLFMKMCFACNMFVVDTLILTLKITETAVKCDLLHYFL